jgi:hypothetical protein
MGCVPQQRHRPLAPTRKRRAVVERPFLPVRRRGKERARRCRPRRGGIAGENVGALCGRAPAGFAPIVADDGNDVDEAPAPHWIVDEVGPAAEPEIDGRRAQLRHDRLGRSKRAPGAVAGEARLPAITEASAQVRPQPIGADQRRAAMLEVALRRARGNRDAGLRQREILDPGAEMESDSRTGVHGLDQHGLQVAAMDDPVRGAVAPLGRRAERRAREHPRRARIDNAKLLGSDDMPLQLLGQAQRQQDARGIGRELNAGADFLQSLRLIEDGDLKSASRDRQGRS